MAKECMVYIDSGQGLEMVKSTGQVAKELGIAKGTLLRWLQHGQLRDVRRKTVGGVEVRIWAERDVARARRHCAVHFNKKPRFKAP